MAFTKSQQQEIVFCTKEKQGKNNNNQQHDNNEHIDLNVHMKTKIEDIYVYIYNNIGNMPEKSII